MRKIKPLEFLLIAGILLGLSGCSNASLHEHSFEEAWTNDEYTHWHKSTCGHDVKGDETYHTYGEWTITKQPTEDEEGTREHECSVCHYKSTGAIAKLPHTHAFAAEWAKDENFHWHESTCSHSGLIRDKAKHSFGAGTITTIPTDKTEGVRTYKCADCGFEKTEPLAKLSHAHAFAEEWTKDEKAHWHASTCDHNLKSGYELHSWGMGVITKAATCTKDGEVKYTCRHCGYVKTDFIPKDHKWNDGETISTATCTEDGSIKYTCSACNATETIVIPATGHSFSTDWTTSDEKHWHASTCGHNLKSGEANHIWGNPEITADATCTTAGSKTYTCLMCGRTKTETINPLGHNWTNPTVTNQPTCTQTGTTQYTCSRCLNTKNENEPAATGHHFDTSTWEKTDTHHWHPADCGCTLNPEDCDGYDEHTDSITTTPATVFAAGNKTIHCTTCEDEIYVIPRLFCESPLDADDPTQEATTSSTSFYFGDFPQTIVQENGSDLLGKDGVTVITIDDSEDNAVVRGGLKYYVGSDGEYYAKGIYNSSEEVYTPINYSDGSGKQLTDERWFRVEPIKWLVLATDYDIDGTEGSDTACLVICDKVIMAGINYFDSQNLMRQEGSTLIYPNNYEYSTIRAYLNGLTYTDETFQTNYTYCTAENEAKGFLQTAFTSTAQALICETLVRNDGASTTDSSETLPKADGTGSYTTDFTCADTTDKIFLLSEEEVTTTAYGFAAFNEGKSMENRDERLRTVTDFAVANLAYGDNEFANGEPFYYTDSWWLRSPRYGEENNVRVAGGDGYAGGNVDLDWNKATVNYDRTGIVPAFTINLAQ